MSKPFAFPPAAAAKSSPTGLTRRIVQPRLGGSAPPVYRPQAAKADRGGVQLKTQVKSRVGTRPAPPVYKPQATAAEVQLKPASDFRLETRLSPPVYRPFADSAGLQPKAANSFRVETRLAPPVYRPQPKGASAQPKMQSAARYQLGPAMWIGQGCQQIRVCAAGSPKPIGSVDIHFDQPGKAFISNLQVAQGHRKHGVGTMLMKAARESARRQGSTATALEANPGPGSISRQALVSMYQKLGFRNTGVSGRGNPMMTVQGKMAPAAVAPGHVAPVHVQRGVIQRALALPHELVPEDFDIPLELPDEEGVEKQLNMLPEADLYHEDSEDIIQLAKKYASEGAQESKVYLAVKGRDTEEARTTRQSIAIFEYLSDNALAINAVVRKAFVKGGSVKKELFTDAQLARDSFLLILQHVVSKKMGGIDLFGDNLRRMNISAREDSFFDFLKLGRSLLTRKTQRVRDANLSTFLDAWAGNLDAKGYGRRVESLELQRIDVGQQQRQAGIVETLNRNEIDGGILLTDMGFPVAWANLEVNGLYVVFRGLQQNRYDVQVQAINQHNDTVTVVSV